MRGAWRTSGCYLATRGLGGGPCDSGLSLLPPDLRGEAGDDLRVLSSVAFAS